MKELLMAFLSSFVGSGIAFALITFLAKKWLDHKLDKASQKFSHELTKEITKLGIHEQYLHERRVKAVENLYLATLEVEQYLKRFLGAWWGHFEHEENSQLLKELSLKFCEQYIVVNNYLNNNAIFFNDEFIGSIKSLYEPLFYAINGMDKNDPPPFPEELKASIIDSSEQPRLEMIKIFRKTLGVELREN